MFVLVTGGTGYVGSNAIAALVAAGHASARSPGLRSASPPRSARSAVETAMGDVTDPAGRLLPHCER
jgi:nucleoside-diphosphate-sugar epimerase